MNDQTRTWPRPESVPAELRLQILEYLLICPDRLAFAPLPFAVSRDGRTGLGNKRREHSDVLHLCRRNHVEKNEPVAFALMTNFSALCRVSKSMRLEAREVFFSKNSWLLHGAEIHCFNSILWVSNRWGAESFSQMTDVRIELQGAVVQDRLQAFKSLQTFVQATNGGSLRNLEVQWLCSGRPAALSRSNQIQLANGHVDRVWRDKRVERNSDGGRGRAGNDMFPLRDPMGGNRSTPYVVDYVQHRDRWAQKEIVLQPLAVLRGLREVRIEGNVTEAWATHLEEAMTASRDQVVQEFEASEGVQENELRDKDGPRVSWRTSGTYYKRLCVI